MANEFDIFNPLVTKVVKGIEGKLILIHSDGVKCGKTTVGSQLPKPYYLRFEQGANAINNMPYAPLNSWSDFKKVNKQLTNPKTLEQARAAYTTIIVDTTDVAIRWCTDYICNINGVARINDGNGGYGLWKEFADEWFREFSKLANAGFCVYFIAHSESREKIDGLTGVTYNQMYPKGCKRTIDIIVEMVDFIGYVKPNGIDDNGTIIPSSCYWAETSEYKAGSRFPMPPVMKEFSAFNLEKAIEYAVKLKEQQDGVKAITNEERKSMEKSEMTYDELINEIKPIVQKLWTVKQQDVKDIIENYLGFGAKITDAKQSQLLQLEMILFDLQDLE
ncbi:MAG: ATP-binding protein [Sarcina sp.]